MINYIFLQESLKESGMSFSDYIALLALLCSIVAPIIIYRTNKKDSIIDVYWMREYFIPQFSNVLFPFLSESPGKFTEYMNLNPDASTAKALFYREYALGLLNRLEDSIIILGVESPELQKKISSLLNEFQDSMMGIEDRDDYFKHMKKFSSGAIKEIQRYQKGEFN